MIGADMICEGEVEPITERVLAIAKEDEPFFFHTKRWRWWPGDNTAYVNGRIASANIV